MPQQGYSPDNPFAPKATPAQNYSADNPFVQKKSPDNPFVEEPQGPLTHILETGKGFIKSTFDDAALAISALGDPYPNAAKVELAVRLQKQQETAAAAAPIFRENLTKFFDTFSKEQFNKTLENYDLAIDPNKPYEGLVKPFKLAGKALAPFGKFSTYGNLASGVVDMLSNPMELMLDEKFSQGGRPLTPEETAQQAQRLLGDATMVLVTHNVSGAINRGLVGKEIAQAATKGIAEGATSEQLLKLARGPAVGELSRKVLSNTLGGVAGGLTGGSINVSGKSDALNELLLQTVMAVPLGFAQEYAIDAVKSLRGKVLDTPEAVAQVAKSIFDERQIKLYSDDSVESTMNKLEALKYSDNLSDAAKKLGTLPEPLAESVVRNPDGTLKIMFHGTNKVFPEYEMTKLDPEALYGPGIYLSDNPTITSSEKGSYAVSADALNVIKDSASEIERAQKKLDALAKERKMLETASNPLQINDNRDLNLKQEEATARYNLQVAKSNYNWALDRYGAPNTRPAYLDIKNPFDIDKTYSAEESGKIMDALGLSRKVDVPRTGNDIYEFALADGISKVDINKALSNVGFDGITHIGGARTGNPPHKVYIAFSPDQIHTPWSVKTTNLTREFDLERFKQNYYNGFKEFAFKTTDALNAQLPEGFDFDQELLKYNNSKNIPQEALPAIREDMLQRLQNEFEKTLNPNEKFAAEKLKFDLRRGQQLAIDTFGEKAAYANRRAAEIGMYVDKDSNGTLVLKSRETGEKIMDLKDDTKLMDGFVSMSGNPKGLRLGNGLDEATGITPPGKPTGPTGNLAQPFSPRYGRMERLLDFFNTTNTGSGFTAFKDVVSSWDNQFKTNFVNKVWDPTQVAYRKTLAKLKPLQEEIQRISNFGKSLTNENWLNISRLRRQRSIDDLVGTTSPIEQTEGKWLNDNDINIAKVFEYKRGINNINKLDISEAERGERITTLQQKLGMDSKHLEAYSRFQTMIKGDENASDLTRTIAWANALKSGISRESYAAANSMTAQQLKIAGDIDKLYDGLAKSLGFKSGRELEDVLDYGQKYGEYPATKGEVETGKQRFLSKMIENNELSSQDQHPLTQAMQYVAAGVKSSEFYPVWKAAVEATKEELSKIDNTPIRKNARMQVESYLSGITGNRKQITDGSIENLTEATNHIRNEAGKGVLSVNEVQAAARRWMSNYFAITEASAQGFRPSQGIRDFYSSINNYYIRFGAGRSARALKLFNSMTKEQIDALEMSGEIGTLKPFEAVLPGDASSTFKGTVARGSERLIEASYGGSWQKRAYRNGHAMAYNETYINTMENLNKLADGTIDKEKAYNNMNLHTYDPGIQVEFDKLASSGKNPTEAATYLARLTAAETIFLYGAANQARYMTSLLGALGGQYTTWSTWESRFLARMMSRGTVSQRLAAGRRFFMSQMAIRAADGITGLNLGSWMLTPSNVIFRPGPTVQAALNMADATSPNQRTSDQALNQLERQGELLIPFFQAGRGWFQAFDMWSRGFDPASGVLRGAGFPVDEQNNNWWDYLIRDVSGLDTNNQTIPSQIFGNEVEKKPSNAGRKAVNQQ